MDLTNKQVIQALLAKHKINPKKSYGQNFLVEKKVLEKILKTADLNPTKPDRKRTILEIGPGFGALTVALLKSAGKVIAVEADHAMIGILQKITESPSNLMIVKAPIQHFRRADYLADGQYDLVANLPYNISSYVLRTFLIESPRPRQIVLMLPKAVAERVVAKAGDADRGLLSLIVELFSIQVKIIQIVLPTAFWPEPKVESAILKIDVKAYGNAPAQSILRIAKIAFSQRRKKIANSLPAEIVAELSENQIDPNLRPQDLTLDQWQKIAS